jgi:hypothetical protein
MPKAAAIAAASIAAAAAIALYIRHKNVKRSEAQTAIPSPAKSSTPPPAVNFATEWLDEDGRVCPKKVDYATQCPKGHHLVPLGGGGGADVMCRVCHALTPRQHACKWLVCGVAGCCGGHAVCAACVALLACSRKAVSAIADDFCMPLCCLYASVVLY